ADSKQVESAAQQATHLYLRVAGYGQLVQVFESVSRHCPDIYNDWREKWRKQTNVPGSRASGFAIYFRPVIEAFREELREERKKEYVPGEECIHTIPIYDN